MNVFGFEITRSKVSTKALSGAALAVPGSGSWWPIIRESFAGAWQTNYELKIDTLLTFSAIFRCISLISSDISKMRMHLSAKDDNDIWREVDNPAYTHLLRRPNHYQNHIQFFMNWMESKLIHGNTYILKERDGRNVVSSMYVLDPTRVSVLVAPDGAVYYELRTDELAGLTGVNIRVPANEIMHDRWNTINHPLVGMSPIRACGLAATQGLRIQGQSAEFFTNQSMPGGMLTAPGTIDAETSARIKTYWDTNFSGKNLGKVMVAGDGLQYTPLSIPPAEAQLIEQLKWTAEIVTAVFGVPAYKLGIGPAPTYNNIEALDNQYYSQCLQIHIESIETVLDEGLELKSPLGTEFDLEGLLRMDTATKVKAAADGVKAGFMAPNEARQKFDLKPVEGGEIPYLQEQNWPLSLLSARELPTRPPTAPAPAEAPPTKVESNGSGDRAGAAKLIDFDSIHERVWRAAGRYDRRGDAA